MTFQCTKCRACHAGRAFTFQLAYIAVFQTGTSSHPTPPEYVFCIETERILAASSVKLQYAIAHSLKNKIPNRTYWDMLKCNPKSLKVSGGFRRIYQP